MKKQEIIEIMRELVDNPDNKFTESVGKDDGKNKIGNNQFRSIASVCQKAECIEEIEMLLKYNHAKDSSNGKWTREILSGMLKAVESIKEASKRDNENVLDNLSLFFGYLYWEARILTANGGN